MTIAFAIQERDGYYDVSVQRSLIPGQSYRVQNVDARAEMEIVWSATAPAAATKGERVKPFGFYEFQVPNPISGNLKPWLKSRDNGLDLRLVKLGGPGQIHTGI